MIDRLPLDLIRLLFSHCREGGAGTYVRAYTSDDDCGDCWLCIEQMTPEGVTRGRRLIPTQTHPMCTAWLYEPLLHVLPGFRP